MRKINLSTIIILLAICITGALIYLYLTKEDVSVEKEMTGKGDAISTIMNRKSVRNYQKGKQISREQLETLIKAGMAAPSGRDIRPWEFVVVADKEILTQMAEQLPTASMLADAPLAIIVCGDKEKSFYWYLDCAAATQNILLAAEALGLGAVWAAAYPYEDRMEIVRNAVNLPDEVLPLCIIPIGYPEGNTPVKKKFDNSKVHYNRW